jgi:hypothetical protein
MHLTRENFRALIYYDFKIKRKVSKCFVFFLQIEGISRRTCLHDEFKFEKVLLGDDLFEERRILNDILNFPAAEHIDS